MLLSFSCKISSTPPRVEKCSRECAGATALDDINLLSRQVAASEARRQLVPIEEQTLPGLDGPKGRGRGSAYAILGKTGPCLLERAILLRTLAILGERVVGRASSEVGGKRVGWTGGVGLGGVVDGS